MKGNSLIQADGPERKCRNNKQILYCYRVKASLKVGGRYEYLFLTHELKMSIRLIGMFVLHLGRKCGLIDR